MAPSFAGAFRRGCSANWTDTAVIPRLLVAAGAASVPKAGAPAIGSTFCDDPDEADTRLAEKKRLPRDIQGFACC
jgi:hypothetical protein